MREELKQLIRRLRVRGAIKTSYFEVSKTLLLYVSSQLDCVDSRLLTQLIKELDKAEHKGTNHYCIDKVFYIRIIKNI